MTVTQHRGRGLTNLARHGSCGRQDKFVCNQKICQCEIDLLKYAVVERRERNEPLQNVTDLNKSWSMSIAGQLVAGQQPKVCRGLSNFVAVCYVLLAIPSART